MKTHIETFADFIKDSGIWIIQANQLLVNMPDHSYSTRKLFLVSVQHRTLEIKAGRKKTFKVHHPAIIDDEDPEPAYDEIVEQHFLTLRVTEGQPVRPHISFLAPPMLAFKALIPLIEPFEITEKSGARRKNAEASAFRLVFKAPFSGTHDLWIRQSGLFIKFFQGEVPPWKGMENWKTLPEVLA